ncbi:SIR2 family protein [Leuconostocaceae bacterium ESL0723]|nr:SIR2 family protein [Leuconostocaceae bacterium ESL0723]
MTIKFEGFGYKLSYEDEGQAKIYEENGEQLKTINPDTGKEAPYTEKEFNAKVRQATQRFMNRPIDHIIVLAGAGASVVVNNKGKIDQNFGKTVEMIAADINKTLSSDPRLYSLKELGKRSKYPKPVSQNRKLDKTFNLEDFLSNVINFEKYLSGSNSATKEKYIKTKNKILELIKKNTDYRYDSNLFGHRKLINVLAEQMSGANKLAIVTTNYDTLFEEAGETEFTVFDGFTFSHKPKFDDDMFEWTFSKEITDIPTREIEYKQKIFDLLKIHGSISWESDGSNVYRKNPKYISRPVMIFPSSNKFMESYQEPYFQLFSRFQDMLRQPNTLLITTGFSFSDMHISRMIIQAITHNPSFYTLVTDFSVDQNGDAWEDLRGLMESKDGVAFLRTTLNTDLAEYLAREEYDD